MSASYRGLVVAVEQLLVRRTTTSDEQLLVRRATEGPALVKAVLTD